MIEKAAMEDRRTFLLFQLLEAHKTCVSVRREATGGVWLITTAHLRRAPGTW